MQIVRSYLLRIDAGNEVARSVTRLSVAAGEASSSNHRINQQTLVGSIGRSELPSYSAQCCIFTEMNLYFTSNL